VPGRAPLSASPRRGARLLKCTPAAGRTSSLPSPSWAAGLATLSFALQHRSSTRSLKPEPINSETVGLKNTAFKKDATTPTVDAGGVGSGLGDVAVSTCGPRS
jgi:hypothetical protein